MSWKQLTERDCREWKLSVISPHDRHTWRSGVRSAMHAASQLPGRGPADVDVAPVPQIKNPMMMMRMLMRLPRPSVICLLSNSSNLFSETTGPITTKCHMEPQRVEGTRIC